MAHHIELGRLNNNEREPVQKLCDGLPGSWLLFTSVSSIPRARGKGTVPEVDCLILGNSHIFVIELKAVRGPVRIYKGQPWEDEAGTVFNLKEQRKFGYWDYHEKQRVYPFKDLLVDNLSKDFPEFDKKIVYGKILVTGKAASIDQANSDSTLKEQVHTLDYGIGQMLKADTYDAEIALEEKLTRAIIGTFLKKFPDIPKAVFDLRESSAANLRNDWEQKAREKAAAAASAKQSKARGTQPPPPPPPSAPPGSGFSNRQRPLNGGTSSNRSSASTGATGTRNRSGNQGGSTWTPPKPPPPPPPTPPKVQTGISPRAKLNHPLWQAMAKWGAMAAAVIGVWWIIVAHYCSSGSSECREGGWFMLQLNTFDLLFLGTATATYFVALLAIHRGTQ